MLPKFKNENRNKRNIIIFLACVALIGLTFLIVFLIIGGKNESQIETDTDFCNIDLVWKDLDGIKIADVLYQTEKIQIQAK